MARPHTHAHAQGHMRHGAALGAAQHAARARRGQPERHAARRKAPADEKACMQDAQGQRK